MKNIYKIIIALIVLVPTVAFGARGGIKTTELNFGAIAPTGINQGNGFINPLRIGDRIEAAYFIASSSVTKSTFPYASSTVISATGICISTDCRTAWPTGGGGGSGGGSWSTTTSTVLGQLVNYPNNATDIINVGSNSTTTGKFYYDPNTTKGFMNGSFVVGTAQPTYADDNLSVMDFVTDINGYTFVGIQNKNTGTTASSDLVFANNKTTITDYYANCGISGGNNADPVFTGIGGASAFYCFNTDGAVSLGIGTTTAGSDFNWTVSHDGGNSYLINDIKMKLTNAGRLGIGTTTPMALLNVAGTTSPQFVIGSDGITESNWGFRDAGGYMFINPINPVTLATSTNPSITMSPTLNQVAIGTSTLAAGVQLTIGAGANPVATLFDSTSATGMYTIYRNSNTDFGYIGSAGVLFTGSAGSKTDLAIRASQNLTFGSGPGEDMRISTTGLVGIATSSPYKPLSVVGAGGVVAENYLATSTTATSTFAGGVDFRTATVQQKMALKFGIATSTAWAGTTTRQLGAITTLQTWNSATCYTTGGTLNIVFGDGTNSTNMIQASSTPSTFALTTNNRFVAGSKSQFSVGTPATSPTEISCTIDYLSNI